MIKEEKGKFHFAINWDWIYVFPTLAIQRNELRIAPKTFRIVFHFYGLHFSWLWTDHYSEFKKFKKINGEKE